MLSSAVTAQDGSVKNTVPAKRASVKVANNSTLAPRGLSSGVTDPRQTPLVRAIEGCSASVVNLRGRKTVQAEVGSKEAGGVKQVNGMGTGVVIDSRGYVLTNYHVVQGVKKIEVTTSEGHKTTAQLLAHDPETDLAILKIDINRSLPTIRIGSSSDLMLAETVAAVGNAYGYEHTVTVGIISQLGRKVQVNDDQIYRNLIQTDASINPGNSGGPLLNLRGEMIGINVAVRIGAQGIAFAIPVNDALDVAARMMAKLTDHRLQHGISARTIYVDDQPQLFVESVTANSPAAKVGISKGDRILAINNRDAKHELDFQCALVSANSGVPLKMKVAHGKSEMNVSVPLQMVSNPSSDVGWSTVGLRLAPISEKEMGNRHPMYKRGLRVLQVRNGSPSESEGILEGDILVAMHGWKTESIDNLKYILNQPHVTDQKSFMFYILREKEPFWGQMRIADKSTAVTSSKSAASVLAR